MSYIELHFYRVSCDYDFGSCKAFICVHAEDHYDALERVLEENGWQRINSMREHCPQHREG